MKATSTLCFGLFALIYVFATPRELAAQPLPGGSLDPASIPKYVTPLVIPPAMPLTAKLVQKAGKNIDYYEIAVRQFQQQILPPGMPVTTVWGYGSVHHPGTFNYPAFTIEAKVNAPVRVKWINDLVDGDGNYLPHLLPVDPTLHWANPPGPVDSRPKFKKTPVAYTGPVPMVPHLHGGHTRPESDGYPQAWFLPAAKNIAGYALFGSWYLTFKAQAEAVIKQTWGPGTAVFQYYNDQRAATLWYHDHTLGMTRVNVYAGPAGFYLLRGGKDDLPEGYLPGPAPKLGDVPGTRYYEVPIAIQDRSFNADGSLFYPSAREFFDEFNGPFIPKSDISPIWNPEFFGNTMVVNGRTWPTLEVEPRRYRFRILDGCDARFLILKLAADPFATRPVRPLLGFTEIGTEGGFLPAPVVAEKLLIGPAERKDVVVDFSGLAQGTEVYLINEGPDEPFAGGEPYEEFEPSDLTTTGQVMRFVVGPLKEPDTTLPPALLSWPTVTVMGPATGVRKLALVEEGSAKLRNVGPRVVLLGTVDSNGIPDARMWDDPVTENVPRGAIQTWELYNFTADAHPIHLHQVMFQVRNRQALVTNEEGLAVAPVQTFGTSVPPEADETGYKDTVIAYPGQVTRLNALFDVPGRFVWHCHIIEHEDNEMMRPLQVSD